MGKIISVHSFRGGTGKTNLTANMAANLAISGLRVAVVDSDIQSPGIHAIFGVDAKNVEFTLNDYIWEKCSLEEAAEDVGQSLTDTDGLPQVKSGALFLVPANNRLNEIAKILKGNYDFKRLAKGYRDLVENLNLDVLFIDTHPGLSEETLLSISISDVLLIILRPDKQDFQGTAVTVDVAEKLNVPEMFLVMNKVLPEMDFDDVRSKMEATYKAPVAGLMPLSMSMARLGSNGLFCLKNPEHVISGQIKEIAARIMEKSDLTY